MHAKTDSEVTSIALSSPSRSPKRPVYYVQSPSRDSHDGEKTTITATTSFHSTPVLSPTGSPHHSQSSLGRHSSSTRFSGSLKPGGSRKIESNGRHNRDKYSRKTEFTAIEEEGLLLDDDENRGIPRRCYFLAFIVGFFSITFDQFSIQAGTDFSGVATDMVSTNATAKLIYRNTGTFFGVHITSTPVDLSFSQLVVGSGTIKNFYQGRKSQRSITVSLTGNNVPLYGGGSSLSSVGGVVTAPVPLTLNFMVRSRAYVLGKLVKPKFYKKVECNVVLDPKKMNVAIPLKNCTYQ
ncbi:Late embryogenesis abundant protein, LEA_2 subgroup [Dillenia turbinata]|uniref:Late embryogenesis abundant protein, LEA_2 subgroup n=1 Tax=Dillenia turbinata TaxID=194707 RepID=A0AAN8Z851_9MAGN